MYPVKEYVKLMLVSLLSSVTITAFNELFQQLALLHEICLQTIWQMSRTNCTWAVLFKKRKHSLPPPKKSRLERKAELCLKIVRVLQCSGSCSSLSTIPVARAASSKWLNKWRWTLLHCCSCGCSSVSFSWWLCFREEHRMQGPKRKDSTSVCLLLPSLCPP